MARNFLNELILCKEYVIDNGLKDDGTPYSVEIRKSLLNLVDYVRQGTWASSRVIAFIARNFTVKQSELPNLWSVTYPNEGTKSPSTFRVHHQNINAFLSGVFPMDIVDAFVNENKTVIREIETTLETLRYNDTRVETLLGETLVDRLNALPSTYKTFEVEDCITELETLSKLSSASTEVLFGGCSTEKLAYVYDILSRPSIKGGKINDKRIDFLKKFLGYLDIQNRVISSNKTVGVSQSEKVSFGMEGVGISESKEALISSETESPVVEVSEPVDSVETEKETETPVSNVPNVDFMVKAREYAGSGIVTEDDFLNPDVITVLARTDERYFEKQLKNFTPSEVALAISELEDKDSMAYELYEKTVASSGQDSVIGDYSFLSGVVKEVDDIVSGVEPSENRVDINTALFLLQYMTDTYKRRLNNVNPSVLARAVNELSDSSSLTSKLIKLFMGLDITEADKILSDHLVAKYQGK